jgi:hypothetical protein
MPTADVRVGYEIKRLASATTKYQSVRDFASRLDDLQQLVTAHQAASGKSPGKRVGLDALNRAALVMLTGHFQGFVTDLFVEAWTSRYPGSSVEPALARFRFNNPWPDDIDSLFELIGQAKLTTEAEWRPSASKAGPTRGSTAPVFVRARSGHQVRQVIAEMVSLRNRAVHGQRDVAVRMSDVTNYLTDCVTLSLRMVEVI